MKTYMTIKETVKEKVVKDKVFCDWCNKVTREYNADGSCYDLVEDRYEVNEFELKWKTGTAYPECGDGEEVEVDLCGKCRIKLFKLLKENGCNINIKEWEY
jgi:hypothetical protein